MYQPLRWSALAATALATSCAGPDAAREPRLSSAALAAGMENESLAARVDGRPILTVDLDAHQAATHLPRAEALDDLVDLALLRAAARSHGIALAPGPIDPDVRGDVEDELARRMDLSIPKAPPRVAYRTVVRAVLHERLRAGKVIEILDPDAR